MRTASLAKDRAGSGAGTPCKITVLYQDVMTHDMAMELCVRVMSHFETQLPFVFCSWSFRELEQPASAERASEAAAGADILLLSTRGSDLPAGLRAWLKSAAGVRRKKDGAYALLVTEPLESSSAAEAFFEEMRYAAAQLNMEYLLLVPPRARPALALEEDPVHPAVYAGAVVEERGHTHWGLNE
jgi:hypothetical protein